MYVTHRRRTQQRALGSWWDNALAFIFPPMAAVKAYEVAQQAAATPSQPSPGQTTVSWPGYYAAIFQAPAIVDWIHNTSYSDLAYNWSTGQLTNDQKDAIAAQGVQQVKAACVPSNDPRCSVAQAQVRADLDAYFRNLAGGSGLPPPGNPSTDWAKWILIAGLGIAGLYVLTR